MTVSILELIRKAKQGDADAQFQLGSRLQSGDGVPKDEKLAHKWLKSATAQGHEQAEQLLQRFPLKDKKLPLAAISEELVDLGTLLDPDQPPHDISTSARPKDAEAQYQLALMYYEGCGLPQDRRQALNWMRKAATSGHQEAQFRLSKMYKDGSAGAQSDSMALYWLRRAAQCGHKDALRIIQRDYSHNRRWFLWLIAISGLGMVLWSFRSCGRRSGLGKRDDGGNGGGYVGG